MIEIVDFTYLIFVPASAFGVRTFADFRPLATHLALPGPAWADNSGLGAGLASLQADLSVKDDLPPTIQANLSVQDDLPATLRADLSVHDELVATF